jgi:ribokinase
MKKEGADAAGIKRAKGPTGTIIGFVDKRGERALYAYPGVNDALEINKKQTKLARSVKYVHLSSFVGKGPLGAQNKLLKELKETQISFAPGMLYAKKFSKVLPIIKKCHVLFLNSEETELLTGSGYRRGASELLDIGAGVVAVTLGKQGCFVADENGTFHLKAHRSKVVDTTGAGDAFAAGFLYGLLNGKNSETCAKMGNWVASRCIAKLGARDGLPYNRDLKKITF